MPISEINGVNINYDVLGERGPFIALSPGGRREMGNVRTLAERLARAGYRVLIHDRRNCGLSDVAFDGSRSEYEIWADDLYALLQQLGDLPAVVGGGSSGGRLALLFALKYPHAVRALLLYRITGGPFAAKRLAYQYYDQYIELVRNGGMRAVADSEHFAQRITANPKNRERLLGMDPKQFVDVMTRWRSHFVASADLPVIGVTEQQLNSITVPTCVIPGNDKTHSHVTGNAAHRMIPGSELHDLWPGDLDIDLFPPEDWATREAEQAAIFVEFLARNGIT
ncbi:MAG: alpha/beta hydrolase [Xanthobacteraceae bacterium]|nr:alpha/beta hydrolase [Xanthobacteraceae bacterium]